MTYPTLSVLLPSADLRLADAAAACAEAWQSHLDVVCIGLEPVEVTGWPMEAGAVLQVAVHESTVAEVADAEAAVRARLETSGVRWTCRSMVGSPGDLRGRVAGTIRFSDLALLRLPTRGARDVDGETLLEAALFQARLPVLMLPSDEAPDPQRIMVAWDGSVASLTAIRAALPLIARAARTDIVMVDPATHLSEQTDPGSALAAYLGRHGAQCEITVLHRTMPRISDMLHRHAVEIGADLLVMGAYGHSRLRESILGGVTRDMIGGGEIPLLLAN